MDVQKAALLKKAVHGEGKGAAQAEDGAEGVGAGAQVGDGAQVFQGMALFLQRIVGVGVAEQAGLPRPEFPLLAGGRGGNQLAGHRQAGAGAGFRDLFEIRQPRLQDDLERGEAGAVVKGDKGDFLASPDGTGPALDGHLRQRAGRGQNRPDGHSVAGAWRELRHGYAFS